MRSNFNNKYKQRRLRSNNFSSFGRRNCRVAETPNTLGSFLFSFSKIQGAFNSSFTKAKKVNYLNNNSLGGSLT